MRFAATHKVVSYLMVSTAFLVLALSGELPPALSLFTFLGIITSYRFDPQRYPFMSHRAYRHGWNVVLIGTFLYLLRLWLDEEALVTVGTRFLCLLLIAKLWNRHGNRDYLHSYIISFFMLVAGSVLNSNLVYGICFVFYVVFTTWTLSLFHLRREMEENYLLKHLPTRDGNAPESERVEVERILNSRRVVGKEFLLGTSLISVAIFLISGIVFFLTPRIGMGLDLGLQRHGLMTSGFSDRIELGGYGRIHNNPQVVMRVEIPSGRPEHTLYLRGVTFDLYERGRWTRSRRVAPRPFLRYMNYHVTPADGGQNSFQRFRKDLNSALRTEIYLEPLDTNVLFAPAKVLAVLPPEGLLPGTTFHISPGPGGEMFSPDRKAGTRYTAYSMIHPPDAKTLLAAEPLPPEHDPELDAYLDVPPSLPSRVRDLAERITKDHQGPHKKAMALLSYLQKNYSYTLELSRNEKMEPLEDFLFEQRQGHCEYFASAMVMMLRASGIPSRSVNGYLGGEWNEYGRYLVVRQQNAHSWVEAYLGEGIGWVTYDPTPPSALPMPETGLWARLKQMGDSLELSWFKYIIEYDLRTQVKMAEGAYRFFRPGRSAGSGGLGWGLRAKAAKVWAFVKTHGPRIALGVAAGAGIVYVLYQLARRRGYVLSFKASDSGRDRVLRQVLAFVRRRGYVLRPAETLRQMAARMEADGDPAASAFGRFVERYYALRFGNETVGSGELRELQKEIVRSPEPRPQGAPKGQGGPPAPTTEPGLPPAPPRESTP